MSAVIAKFVAVAFSVSALCVAPTDGSVAAIARDRAPDGGTAGLPLALERAAIATRSERSGRIAGARIGSTRVHVVYIETARGCGSGGCRAQTWRRQGDQFVRMGSLPVGRLPIIVFRRTAHGMPVLGVTVFDKRRGGLAVLPITFDGTGYATEGNGRLLAAKSGSPLLAMGMLRSF